VTEKSLSEILDRVVAEAVEVTPGEYGELWLFDADTGNLTIQATVGPIADKAIEVERIAEGEDSTNLRVAQTGEYEIHHDLDQENVDFYRIYEEAKSSVTVPLKYQDRIIGTLNVESAQPRAFGDHHANLLDSFSDAGAVAIENSQLYERRSQDIAILQEVNEAITTQELKDVWKLITEKATALANAEYSAIWSREGTMLKFQAVSGDIPEEKQHLPDLPIDERSINGYVGKHGETYPCYDVENDPHYLPWIDNIQSSISIPLKFEDRVIGTLGLESSKPQAFSAQLVSMLESLANQASVAIQNTRLYGQKVDSLTALAKIGQRLASGVQLSESEILQLVYEQATELMETSNMYIALYDTDKDEVRFPLMFVEGLPQEVAARVGGHGRTEWIIENRKAVLIETLEQSKEWYAEPGRTEYIGQPFASWIGVPMSAGGEVLGVIAAYHQTTEHLYDKNDLEILSLMADYAAVALKNSQQLELLRDLTVDLSAGLFDEGV
jgi:GAF domain-containing protein